MIGQKTVEERQDAEKTERQTDGQAEDSTREKRQEISRTQKQRRHQRCRKTAEERQEKNTQTLK